MLTAPMPVWGCFPFNNLVSRPTLSTPQCRRVLLSCPYPNGQHHPFPFQALYKFSNQVGPAPSVWQLGFRWLLPDAARFATLYTIKDLMPSTAILCPSALCNRFTPYRAYMCYVPTWVYRNMRKFKRYEPVEFVLILFMVCPQYSTLYYLFSVQFAVDKTDFKL